VSLPVVGGPAAPERADAARNRARNLETARRLVGRRPNREICMDELARAAGVGKGTLYRRFADRSSLCLALLDESERKLQTRVLANFGMPLGTPAATQLTTLLDELVGFVIENAALLAEARAFERGHPARFDIPVHAWRRMALTRLIAQASREGAVQEIDAEIAADLILAALDPDLVVWRLENAAGPDALVALRRAYLDHFRRSVGLPAG
jgi:AcrR family transcriptional regulator